MCLYQKYLPPLFYGACMFTHYDKMMFQIFFPSHVICGLLTVLIYTLVKVTLFYGHYLVVIQSYMQK